MWIQVSNDDPQLCVAAAPSMPSAEPALDELLRVASRAESDSELEPEPTIGFRGGAGAWLEARLFQAPKVLAWATRGELPENAHCRVDAAVGLGHLWHFAL